jgi:hypothetical protein
MRTNSKPDTWQELPLEVLMAIPRMNGKGKGEPFVRAKASPIPSRGNRRNPFILACPRLYSPSGVALQALIKTMSCPCGGERCPSCKQLRAQIDLSVGSGKLVSKD